MGGLELAARVPSLTQYVQGGYPPALMLGSLAATLVLGLLAGGYPAVQASRVDPLVVLRGGE